jgi:hypothetical protein
MQFLTDAVAQCGMRAWSTEIVGLSVGGCSELILMSSFLGCYDGPIMMFHESGCHD